MIRATIDEPVLAVDFGTSFSTMCRMHPGHRLPEVVKNAAGHDKTPSVVHFGPADTLVGEVGEYILTDSHRLPWTEQMDVQARTVLGAKRLLRDNLPLPVPDQIVRPADAVGAILSEMKRQSEELCFHREVERTVLTHPVTFTEREKKRLRSAAKKAGLQQVELLEEPVAAALGYATAGVDVGHNLLVYDLGGGTFDLSFVRREADGSFGLPLESLGIARCGGDDFDQAIYDHLECRCRDQHGVGFSLDAEAVNKKALRQCRTAKERLTTRPYCDLSVMVKADGRDIRFGHRLTREEFESLIKPLVFQTIEQLHQMLARIEDAGYPIDAVLFVGGATRVPYVQQEVTQTLPLPPTKTMYADVAVAMGAAASVMQDATGGNGQSLLDELNAGLSRVSEEKQRSSEAEAPPTHTSRPARRTNHSAEDAPRDAPSPPLIDQVKTALRDAEEDRLKALWSSLEIAIRLGHASEADELSISIIRKCGGFTCFDSAPKAGQIPKQVLVRLHRLWNRLDSNGLRSRPWVQGSSGGVTDYKSFWSFTTWIEQRLKDIGL